MRGFKLSILLLAFSVLSVAAEGIKNPFLWEVSKKGTKSFYLFGTMHFQDAKLAALPSQLKEAIDKSDEVRTEIPMDMELQMQSMHLMLRTDHKSLHDILSKDLYKRTEQYLKKINPQLNLIPFDTMKIWALSTVISMLENELNNPGILAIDHTIYNYAKNKHKITGGIETIAEQIGAMDKLNLEEQIIALESTLDYMEENHDYTEEMKQLYISGDEKKMMGFINGMMFEKEKYKAFEKKFMQVILYDRNNLMFKRIEALLKKSPKKHYLFAFGVMHFLGEQSIIEKLKFRGYSVKRVK